MSKKKKLTDTYEMTISRSEANIVSTRAEKHGYVSDLDYLEDEIKKLIEYWNANFF